MCSPGRPVPSNSSWFRTVCRRRPPKRRPSSRPKCRGARMPESHSGAHGRGHDLRLLPPCLTLDVVRSSWCRVGHGAGVVGGSGVRVGGWYGSDRRARLPRDWAAIRAMVRDRAHNHCQARVHSALCNGIGDDCDHIVPGDDHSLANLQWLNHNCHKLKTSRESAERNARRARQRKHPVEKNPGSFR